MMSLGQLTETAWLSWLQVGIAGTVGLREYRKKFRSIWLHRFTRLFVCDRVCLASIKG